MKMLLLSIAALLAISLVALQGASPAPEVYPARETKPEVDVTHAVEVTEIGCMRTLLLLDEKTAPLEKLVAQRLTEVDFRVFPSSKVVAAKLSAAAMRDIGTENKADLVLFASANVRKKNAMGDFQLFEGEATVQIFSPISGEMIVSQTSRGTGTRSVDPVDAERSAIEKALDDATKIAIARGLQKSRKILVHRAIVKDVKDQERLLTIMNYMAKMEGVYHVRQLSFDPKTRVAELEILGQPQSESFWRAWLDRMPRTRVTVAVKQNRAVHAPADPNRYPEWFRK